MIRATLVVLLLLFLQGCGTRTVKDDSPASDLHAMQAGMQRALAPRMLPNGKTYCAEDAATQYEQDLCMGDLEDAFFSSEQDKARALTLFERWMRRLELARNPCGFWERVFNRDRCDPKIPLHPKNSATP